MTIFEAHELVFKDDVHKASEQSATGIEKLKTEQPTIYTKLDNNKKDTTKHKHQMPNRELREILMAILLTWSIASIILLLSQVIMFWGITFSLHTPLQQNGDSVERPNSSGKPDVQHKCECNCPEPPGPSLDDLCLATPEAPYCRDLARRERYVAAKQPQLDPRTVFTTVRTMVYCYPRIGREWVLFDVTTAEIEFLGLSRSIPEYRSQDQDEEDKFCSRLKILGPLQAPERNETLEYDDDYTSYILHMNHWSPSIPRPRFCWPKTGGVWVRTLPYSPIEDKKIPYADYTNIQAALGAIKHAHTMEERCEAFAKAGAKFCANVEDCEETRGFAGVKIWPDVTHA